MARSKKQSAKSGLQIGASAPAPPNTIRLDAIVEEIVHNHLRPWKRRMSEAAVTAEVNRELEELLKLPSQETLRSYQKEDRTLAKQLYGALTEVETLLASARGQLAWSLFYPLWLWIDGGMARRRPLINVGARARKSETQ
jgi:hypothetical protein